MKFRFDPEKCAMDLGYNYEGLVEVVMWCQQQLEAHEKSLPRVYGFKGTDDDWTNEYNHSDYGKEETHTAVLWNIEEIK